MRRNKHYNMHIHLEFDQFYFKVDKYTEEDIAVIIKRIKHYPGLIIENIVGSDWYVVTGAQFVLYRALLNFTQNPNITVIQFERELE